MISHGIVDNDNDGKTGVGTIFWMKVTVGDKTTHYEYSLLDWLSGKFDKEGIIKPAREEAARLAKEQLDKDIAEKKAALSDRQAAVSISPALDTIVTSVIANNSKVVEQYKSGKEKALNSLVGMVIAEAKKQSLSVDGGAFAITTLLKQKLQ